MTGKEAWRRAPPNLKQPISNTRARQQMAPDALHQKAGRGGNLLDSLPALQNIIKRSPESYTEEFITQWNRFTSLVKIVQLGLGGAKGDEEKLREVTNFVCQVANLYPTLTKSLPSTLSSLLLSSAPAASTSSAAHSGGIAASGGGIILGPETRRTMMQGLVLLRRREVISGIE